MRESRCCEIRGVQRAPRPARVSPLARRAARRSIPNCTAVARSIRKSIASSCFAVTTTSSSSSPRRSSLAGERPLSLVVFPGRKRRADFVRADRRKNYHSTERELRFYYRTRTARPSPNRLLLGNNPDRAAPSSTFGDVVGRGCAVAGTAQPSMNITAAENFETMVTGRRPSTDAARSLPNGAAQR